MDNTELGNLGKAFDFVTGGTITPVTVKQLTFRQRNQLRQQIEEEVKAENRKEFLLVAESLKGKERSDYLIASAKANSLLDEAKLEQKRKSDETICKAVSLATGKTVEEVAELQEENGEMLVDAYLYCLGIKVEEPKDKKDGVIQGESKS
jgi:hypothetical protein